MITGSGRLMSSKGLLGLRSIFFKDVSTVNVTNPLLPKSAVVFRVTTRMELH